MFEGLLQSSEIALNDCCSLKRHEKLLIICDLPSIEIGRAFYIAAENRCQETVLVMVTPVNRSGRAEFPESVIEMLSKFDVAVIPLASNISHSQTKQIAVEYGIRIASFPGINNEIFIRTMQADWRKVGVYTRKVAGRLSTARQVRVISDLGTDFTFEINGSMVSTDDGRLPSDGGFGVLPAGQVCLIPREGTAKGVVVIDGSISLSQGRLEHPLVFSVQEGLVCGVGNHTFAPELEKYFGKYKEGSRCISLFGIGALDTAKVSGNLFEDKVARGAIYLIFGKKSLCADTVNAPLPLEAIISCTTVFIDGKLLLKDGILA